MAALTRVQVRTAFREAINDADGDAWGDTAADQLLSLVCDQLFAVLLTNWPWLTSVAEAEVPVASAIALSGLTSARFFAVQRVVSGSTEYKPKILGEAYSAPGYYILGGNIVTETPGVGVTSTTITYSYLPTRVNALASDATALADYPEGHEAALIYLAAAWALTRGDQESMAQIVRLADSAVDALLTHIARRYPTPVQPSLTAIKAQIMTTVLAGA